MLKADHALACEATVRTDHARQVRVFVFRMINAPSTVRAHAALHAAFPGNEVLVLNGTRPVPGPGTRGASCPRIALEEIGLRMARAS